ncbi:MAG: peptidoglycan bridge formation glycyltransferase FemA/FemB family protein [Actinomyces sp.]|uniref:lipid II:glycine glycyltransferase FemX n=1 Tax=Actinomyces sp. TaxID=29317 RepID=UPI0026DB571F|nr:GNAT family N-acetyltransferase [Actinomyces sp.]MDO4242549.1 peptidoglycan bridge formation glycyltransferase FemA/FemB family protein [Actinomyces sp.]
MTTESTESTESAESTESLETSDAPDHTSQTAERLAAPDAAATPRSGTMRRVDWETFRQIAVEAGVTLPIEQTSAWDAFDAAMEGREPWGRVVYHGADGAPRALVALSRMEVRGLRYLWARHAPVWLGGAPTAAEEAELRELLVAGVRHHDRSIVFVRLHAEHRAEGFHELLQTMTYDRTVVIDLDLPDDEAVLASFKSRGRRDVRKALRNDELTYHDETERAEEVFDELYDILTETGERDGFRAATQETYLTMLRSLGPQHARLYVARRRGEEALVWSLVTVWGDQALRYYAGSSAEGRRMRAADALVYKEACWLRAEGVRHYDLMGVDSDRVPELAGVREFKNKFVTDGPVEVPGAWDVPVRPRVYAAMVAALEAKHRVQATVGSLQERAGRLRGAVED